MGASQSTNKITAQDKAILDMKVQRDKLKQYQKRVQTVLDRQDTLARELLLKGDKKRALLALRRRKYQTQMIHQADDQLFNLQQLMETIEFSLVQKDVLFGLEQGQRALTQLNKEMRIEDVERLADDTAEAIAYQEEVSEILNGKMSAEDEEAVLRELEEIERQEVERENKGILPEVPKHQIKHTEDTKEEEEEEELRHPNEPMLAE